MKTQNPWMGRVRGSAGNMTGCKVYDKNVLRAKAFEVSNPDTAAQQTQRAFFKEVADIVATVSDEELRSLFGIKPKAMSRRNALSKQVAAAFSVDATGKHVDFSKLQAIGNGKKVTTSLFQITAGQCLDVTEQSYVMFGISENSDANIILVLFDTDNNRIVLANTESKANEALTPSDFLYSDFGVSNGFAYMTCSTDGNDVSSLPFGSFTLKTRSVGKQAPPTPPTPEMSIYSGGTTLGSFFHFDDSMFDPSIEDQPSVLKNGDTILCSDIRWDEVNNWWYGTTIAAVDTSLPITVSGTIDYNPSGDIYAEWVVQ